MFFEVWLTQGSFLFTNIKKQLLSNLSIYLDNATSYKIKKGSLWLVSNPGLTSWMNMGAKSVVIPILLKRVTFYKID